MRDRKLRVLLVSVMALAPLLGGAEGGCSPVLPIGEDPVAGSGGEGAEGIRCGDTTCADGQVCCNPSCGVCTHPGGACTNEVCGEASCSDTMAAIRDLATAHRACDTDTDCTTVNVSCLPSSNCTGNLYVNVDLDQDLLAELTRDLNTCVNGHSDAGCAVCDRFDPAPVCIGNSCQSPTTSPPPAEPPCSGKACGEPCSRCVEGQPCAAIFEVCDGNGACGGSVPCRSPAEPCAGKACGDTCSTCVPGQPCLAILEVCNENGICGGFAPVCR